MCATGAFAIQQRQCGPCHLHLCPICHHGHLHGLFHIFAAQAGREPAGPRRHLVVLFIYADVIQLRGAADQRCAVCRRVFGAVGADREARGLRPAPSRCQCQARGRTGACALCTPRLAVARAGCHGFHVFAQWRPGLSVGGLRDCGGVLRLGRACGPSRGQTVWRHALVRHATLPLGRRARSACALPCLQHVFHQGLYAGARYHAGLQARDPLDSVSADGALRPKARRP